MTAPQLSAAQLRAMLAQAEEREARLEAEEEARRASRPQELVPASPSPRKKRSRPEDFPSSSSRPIAPSFFDKPKADRTFGANDGKVELMSRPRESKFSSHESAIPKDFADRLAEQKAIQAAKDKRDKAKQERSKGFNDLSTDSRNMLLGGKTGGVALFDKGKGREKADSEVRKEKKRQRDEQEEDDPVAQLFKAAVSSSTGGGIGRPTPRPSSSAVKEEKDVKPLVRQKKKEDEDDDDDLDIVGRPKKRNEDGTVVEEIEMGPRDFEPRADDPEWERVEPYSGTKLRKRLLPHSTVDSLLTGRYHLTPSQIYSLARIDSRQRIDVDPETIDSDWIVIGVLAQKGEVRFLNSNPYGGKMPPPEGEGKEGDADAGDDNDEAGAAKGKGKGKEKKKAGGRDDLFAPPTARKRSQKYLRFDLVDFSSSRASQSGHGRLGVMLVEADTVDKAVDDEGNEVNVYKGGSGGAYEKFWKETPGAVVAIMNPQFLNYSNKFPTYTIKPSSADSMVVIGRAAHLAFCDATTKEGKPCGSWVDDRTGKFCDFHVKRALQRTGAGRAETNANTASMSKEGQINLSHLKKSMGAHKGGSSSSSSSKPKPNNGVSGISGGSVSLKNAAAPPVPPALSLYGSTTYVTSGTRASTMSMRSSNLLPSSLSASTTTSATSGSRHGGHFVPGLREGPSVSEEKKRLKRRAEEDKRARRELRELVRGDGGKTNGGEMVMLAGRRIGRKDPLGSGSGKGKGKGCSDAEEGEGEGDEEEEGRERKKRRSVLSGAAARKIGFDPTARGGDDREKDQSEEAKQFRSLLENGHTPTASGPRREFDLSAPPGPRIRSVGAPVGGEGKSPVVPPKKKKEVVEERMVDLDEDDDGGLVVEGGTGERLKISLADLVKR
ncbi:hypothetical protein JCM6882_008571 [Rhodosporidiobolus microsporus]